MILLYRCYIWSMTPLIPEGKECIQKKSPDLGKISQISRKIKSKSIFGSIFFNTLYICLLEIMSKAWLIFLVHWAMSSYHGNITIYVYVGWITNTEGFNQSPKFWESPYHMFSWVLSSSSARSLVRLSELVGSRVRSSEYKSDTFSDLLFDAE